MRKIEPNVPVAVVGAGLVGSLLAICLSKKGFQVQLFEKRDDPRLQLDGGKRSINLALSDRGWNALQRIGLVDELKALSLPMYGRLIHNAAGDVSFQSYDPNRKAIYSISRKHLNDALLNMVANDRNIKCHFNHQFVGFDVKQTKLSFMHTGSNRRYDTNVQALFGADGCFSQVRGALDRHLNTYTPVESNTHGYKQLTIPASAAGECQLSSLGLHIWPRGKFMLIALPNIDNTFTCTLFLPRHGEQSLESLDSAQKVLTFFTSEFSDVVDLIPNLDESYLTAPVCELFSVNCQQWNADGFVTLIGDAAHSILPFYGQGMNAGFEDCVLLSDKLEQADDWDTLFQDFQQSRKPDTDAIAELSQHNFEEMQGKVADSRFLLRKEIESFLGVHHAPTWISQYSLVSFSTIPYRVAREKGFQQEAFLDRIMSYTDIEKCWQSIDYESLLQELNVTDSNLQR